MTNTGYENRNKPPTMAGIGKWTALTVLLAFSSLANAEVYTGGDVQSYPGNNAQTMSANAIAVPKDAAELRIYKQRFEITADVFCRVPKKGPSYCKTNIGTEIDYQVQPEMILKYKSVRLDGQEFATEITPQGALQFRTNKVDYSGSQTFEIEIIYLK